MADEKQPAPDPDPSELDPSESGPSDSGPSKSGPSDSGPSDSGTDVPKQGKRWAGRGSWAILIFLGLLAVGFYLSWPMLQSRLLPVEVSPQNTQVAQTAAAPDAPDVPNALEAAPTLEQRVAKLEAADARRDQAVDAIKSAMDAFTRQLADLSQGLSGDEVLATLRGKLATLEKAMEELGQQAGENSAAALAALGAEVSALKARLGDLASGAARTAPEANSKTETSKTGAADAVAPVSVPTQEEVTALAQQTTALANDNKELRQALAALQARLEQLQGVVRQSVRAGQKAGAGQGLVLAVGQLRQTVLAGTPYTADLAAVTALAGDDIALQRAVRTLAPMAGAGIIGLRALSDQFAPMARAVLRASSIETGSFWRRTLHRLTSVVTVRRVGEVDGMEVDAVLARAERRLTAGELAAAIGLIDGLDGPAATAARPWLDRAKARLAALAALAELQSRAIAQLADG